MSLVVAKIIDGRIRIESDTQLSINRPDVLKQNPMDAVLKVIIVAPNIAVCFAGDVDAAHKTVTKVFLAQEEKTGISPTEVSALLLNAHIDYNKSVEFILAVGEVDNLQLYKISNGEITKENNSAWIGDKAGFTLFQSRYIKNQPNDIDYYGKWKHFSEAFSSAIQDRYLAPSVAGFQITAVSSPTNGIFKYMSTGIAYNPPSNSTIKMNMDNVALGGYSASHFSSGEEYTPATAIVLEQLKIGLLFIPSISLNMIRIDDLNGCEFIQLVNYKYGITLNGFWLDLENSLYVKFGDFESEFKSFSISDNSVELPLEKRTYKLKFLDYLLHKLTQLVAK